LLAYVFWHRPRDRAQRDAYEHALCTFHRSLARRAPAGMVASAVYRVAELPWRTGSPLVDGELDAPAYEDWYIVEDFASLGVLNEAAVGRGHRSSHDEAAHRYGAGTGALYALLEGEPSASVLAGAALAVWVARPAGSAGDSRQGPLAELLGDGMDPHGASLWRRTLVLGPAAEYCLLGREVPSGVGAARLPQGWTATVLERDVLWSAAAAPS